MNKVINVKFPNLYDAQKEVIKAALDPKVRTIVLNGSRQVGKSLILVVLALYWALKESNQIIMVVSPTYRQVKKLYKDMIAMIGNNHKSLIESHKGSSGDCQIRTTNGSTILFFSSGSADAIRGHSVTHLLADEMAFQKEETWNEILQPTLSVRGKKIFICSTPRGTNHFHKQYSKGLNMEDGFKSFKITYHDNPFADYKFIQQQQKDLLESIFNQEYLGIFTDASGVFSNVDNLALLYPSQPPKECVIGIDIAFQTDYTVAVALSKNGEMLDYVRFHQVETPEAVDKLTAFINKWKPTKTLIEDNHQGIAYYHLLKQKGIQQLQTFNTNGKTKPELINQLIAVFGNKEIKLLNDEIVKEEFKAYGYKLSTSGKLTFQAAPGYHDDIVMATAIAWEAKKKYAVYNLVIRR